MGVILVQFGEHQRTMRAMHLACAMACTTNLQVLLLMLERAPNPFLLGAEIGVLPPTPRELAELKDYAQIASEYGLPLAVQPMQYDTISGALAQAVEEYEAVVAFVQLPHSRLPLVDRVERWSLNRQLQACGCKLVLTDEPAQGAAWVPSISIKSTR
jgi:hypothetical protein